MSESSNSSGLTKVALTVADGKKMTVEELAKDLKPLLIVVLNPDTVLCNKMLNAINDLHEEGVFANKCTPIAVLLGTLNEIENWESKMRLKFAIVQGTPDFVEQLGCASRGKTKRGCVLLGREDSVEFVDTAIKAGVSFIPKLKEYLASVPVQEPAPAAPAAAVKQKGGKKPPAASRAAAKKAPQKNAEPDFTEPAAASAPAAAPAPPAAPAPAALASTTTPPEAEAAKAGPKLKVTRKSVAAVEKPTAKKKAAAPSAPGKTAAPSASSGKNASGKNASANASASMKRAAAGKKRTTSGVASGASSGVTPTTTTPAAASSPPPGLGEEESAALVSTSAPGDEPQAAPVKEDRAKKTRAPNKTKRRNSDPTSDIDSPPAAVPLDQPSRQRKRIKTAS